MLYDIICFVFIAIFAAAILFGIYVLVRHVSPEMGNHFDERQKTARGKANTAALAVLVVWLLLLVVTQALGLVWCSWIVGILLGVLLAGSVRFAINVLSGAYVDQSWLTTTKWVCAPVILLFAVQNVLQMVGKSQSLIDNGMLTLSGAALIGEILIIGLYLLFLIFTFVQKRRMDREEEL